MGRKESPKMPICFENNFYKVLYIKQFLVSVSAIQMCVCVCGGGGDVVCNDLFGVYYLMILCCLYQKE